MLKLLRLMGWMLTSLAAAVVLAAGATWWLSRDAQRPGPLAGPTTLVIPSHTGLVAIAELLARDGVIRHSLTFAAIAELSGRGHGLQSGEYQFPARASAIEVLAIIAGGRMVRHKLTIPEGLTSPQVVALVRAARALTGDPGPVPPEGSLFPDTYIYSYGESRQALLARMRRAMVHVVGRLWQQRWPGLPLTRPEDAVTLASIVEKETAVPAERAHIAGVYINRLRRGMALDADPTVLYALEQIAPAPANGAAAPDHTLTHADLAIASPYNTYRVKGLPPGPIDNPGRASLRAAMQPEPTDDLYFVADGKGGHVFSKTLADQTRNIDTYLKPAAAIGAAVAPAPAADPAAKALPPPAAAAAAPGHPVGRRAAHHGRRFAVRHAAYRHPCRPSRSRRCRTRAR
ncbi:MAG TPA: endolytic transglycosylase MltG [Stellaceae bacterium]|nr:endolytic transglycosylase MltG [Stellaceae bacterium]